jgi:hypothetical protein
MNKIIIIFMITALNQVCIYSQPFSTQLEWEAYYDNNTVKLDPIEGYGAIVIQLEFMIVTIT